MLSSRTRWDLRPNRLAERLAERRAAGRRLLDLTESNPTRAGLPYPADLLAPLAQKASLRYEPSPFGLPAARRSATRSASRFGRRSQRVREENTRRC